MRKSLATLVSGIYIATLPLALVHAASGDIPPVNTGVTVNTGVNVSTTPTGAVSAPALLSAPATQNNPPVAPKAGSALGEYKSVSCNSQPAFGNNSCNQCFDGGSVKVGQRLTGLFDTWINNSSTTYFAYKEEQKSPNMVRFGNTTWTSTPAVEANIWKYSSEVAWMTPPGETKSQFLLNAGEKVKWIEADLGAGYTLEKTDKKSGDLVGLLRFPIVSRTLDLTTANEGPATTHYECVAYRLESTQVVEVPPTSTGKTTPTSPPTQAKTGPETLFLIAAAFFIAFGMMFTLRRRV